MDCPTCAAPNQASGTNCRKCGVLVIRFGAPSAAAPKRSSSLPLPSLGTLVIVALLGVAAYALFWPKPQDVSPVAAARGAMDWSTVLHPGALIDRAKMLASASKAKAAADDHTNALISELQGSGEVSAKDVSAESAAPQTDGKNPAAARDAANAQTAAQSQELSKIDSSR